jgi:glycosyltransferase involved in cell wall biosynthesis
MGIGEEKLFFSPYSIDDDLFRSMRRSVHREDARKMLAINDEFVILYSAKLIPRKNPIFIANLFKRLSQLKPGRFKLIMLGDGPQWNQTNAILHEEIEKRIAILPGFTNQTELGLYFAAADLFVLPSSKDSWGVVVNEAMSFGLPCVVSDQVGCGIDLIREGVTGYTLPVCQERWLETILRLSGKEFDIGRMRTAATEHISSFSSERAAAGIREAVLN